MNIKEIKELLSLMDENNLLELEIEKDGMRIRLKKSGAGEPEVAPLIIEKATAHTKYISPEPEKAQPSSVKTIEIKSPMVGTFYRAPSPEAPPYVEVDQVITPGEVICIIEAMKLMNEIKSEIKGKIIEILVENVEPVEFAQPLFLVEPL